MQPPNTILVVDDDARFRKTLADILRFKGFTVLSADSGATALSEATTHQPAVALIDLKLDDMPGLALIREVKHVSPQTECIVLTGYATQSSAIEAVNLGAYGYIQKPYDIDGLLITIQRAIEKQAAEDALHNRTETLNQRVKELNCLYGISRLVEQPGTTLDTILQGTVNLIADAVQHAEQASVRLVIDGHVYQTANFQAGILHQTRDIVVYDRAIGQLEIIYHTETSPLTPTEQRDENSLLNAIAERVGRLVEWQWNEIELKRHREHLEDLVAERTAELEQANAHLRALSQLKDEFVANVSHELRTPIMNLKLRQHLLAAEPHNVDEHLGVMRRETQRFERLIDDLLYLSRLDRQHVEFNPIEFDLNQMVREYVNDRTSLADTLGLTLAFEADATLPPVRADESMWGQALSVLLTNALNYTPAPGRVTVTTAHRTDDTGDPWAVLSVHDTGPGIDPTEQDQLFERFFRGQAALDSGTPGTGLGLAIVQAIVDQHQGQIQVESSGIPGEGTTFSLWLALAADLDHA